MGDSNILTRRLGEKPASEGGGSIGRPNVLRRLIGWIAALIERLLPTSYLQKQEILLIRANMSLKPTEFFLLKLVGGLFLLFLGLLLRWNILMTLGAAFFGWLFPTLFARRRQAQRLNKFTLQLENALNLMVSTLRAGFSFQQAIKIIASEMPPPISEEFSRVVRELNLGLPLEDALHNLARFIVSPDLDLMVTCVLIQSETGGNLAEILDKVSRTIRERLKLQNDVKALTAQGKLSGWVVGLLPFGLMGIISMINPTYIKLLFEHPLGRILLGTAIFMELIGAFFISRVVKIEV